MTELFRTHFSWQPETWTNDSAFQAFRWQSKVAFPFVSFHFPFLPVFMSQSFHFVFPSLSFPFHLISFPFHFLLSIAISGTAEKQANHTHVFTRCTVWRNFRDGGKTDQSHPRIYTLHCVAKFQGRRKNRPITPTYLHVALCGEISGTAEKPGNHTYVFTRCTVWRNFRDGGKTGQSHPRIYTLHCVAKFQGRRKNRPITPTYLHVALFGEISGTAEKQGSPGLTLGSTLLLPCGEIPWAPLNVLKWPFSFVYLYVVTVVGGDCFLYGDVRKNSFLFFACLHVCSVRCVKFLLFVFVVVVQFSGTPMYLHVAVFRRKFVNGRCREKHC